MSMKFKIIMSLCLLIFTSTHSFELSAESCIDKSTPVSDTFTYLGDEYRLYRNGDHIYAAVEGYIRNDDTQSHSIYIPPMVRYEGKYFPIEEIGDAAFENYGDARRLTIPPYVKRIGKNAFKGCHASEYVKFEDNDSEVAIEGEAFDGFVTKKLIIGASLKFASNSSNVIKVEETLEFMFNIKTIPQYANLDVSDVKELIVGSEVPPAFEIDDVRMIYPSVRILHVPYYCKGKYQNDANWRRFDNIIEDVQLVITSEDINYIVSEDRDEVKAFCNSSDKQCVYLPEYVDYENKSFPLREISIITANDLKTISIPSTITEIWGAVFIYCQNLENVIIEDSKETLIQHDYLCNYITSQFNPVKKFYIGRNYLCPRILEGDLVGYMASLEELTYGKDVTEIAKFTIGINPICNQLRDVYSYNSVPPKAYLTSFSKLPAGVVLHVPAGCREVYSVATGWNNFTTIVEDANSAGVEGVVEKNENKNSYDLYGRKFSYDKDGTRLLKKNGNVEVIIR